MPSPFDNGVDYDELYRQSGGVPADEPVSSPSQVPDAGPDNYMHSLYPGSGLGEGGGPEATASNSTGSSVATSRSGTNLATVDRLGRKGSRIDKELSAIDAKGDDYRKGYDDKYAAIGEQEKKSLIDTNAVEQKKADFQSFAASHPIGHTGPDDPGGLKEQNDTYMRAEAEADVKQKAAYTSYMADYNAQLQQIRATNINPGKLFSDMTGGEKAGMLTTAFVHDFLGAKGIQTSSMDIYNKAIERSVDAQIQNLGNKRAALGEFAKMYEAQRAQSASEEEARTRMHGFALQSYKDSIQSKLSQFDSENARAGLGKGLAEIDKSIADNTLKLDGMVHERTTQDKDLALKKRGQELTAGHEAIMARIAQQEADTHRQLANHKDGTGTDKLREQAVRGEGGKLLGFAPDKESRKEFQEQATATSNFTGHLKEAIDLGRQLGNYYHGKGSAAFETVDKAKLEGLMNKLTFDYVKVIGSKQVDSDKEKARLDKVFKSNEFLDGLVSGDKNIAQYVLSQFNVNMIADAQKTFNDGLTTAENMGLTPEQAKKYGGGTEFDFLGKELTEAQVNSSKPTDTTGPASREAAKIGSYKAKDQSGERTGDRTDLVNADELEGTAKDLASGVFGKLKTGDKVPEYYTHLTKIYDLAVDGDKDALKILGNFAVDGDNQERKAISQYLLKELSNNEKFTGDFKGQYKLKEEQEAKNRNDIEGRQARKFADEKFSGFGDDYVNDAAGSIYSK